MNPYLDFSPVSLSYVGALRGMRPRRPGESFTYAAVNVTDPDQLVCLAASNPEGHFYGLVAHAADRAEGEKLARARQVVNVMLFEGGLADLLAQAEKGTGLIPSLHYLCCDERQTMLSASERAAMFALAEKLLLPGGLFSYSYRAYKEDGDALSFLVRELAPEMDAGQAKEFLQELKKLGAFYFSDHPDMAAKLNQAIAAGVPDRFFADYERSDARSGSLDTILALGARGFAYAGDAHIPNNYIELAAPSDSHQLIIDCRRNPLYEPIKDFALNRQERCDIWCRRPVPMSASAPELFGTFVYGITVPRSEIPLQLKTQGKPVDLSAPLFAKLIDLMTLMPLSIGDFLTHVESNGFAPSDIVAAVQVLVACGIARPMRGHYRSATRADAAQPRLAGVFNQYLAHTTVTGAPVLLSSPMAGSAVAVSAREALVMQALNRAGLANSVSALLPELERLAKDPASASRVMDQETPTPEMACDMIKDTVSRSIVQWYAYGLLSAA
jgi:hypothetical protein